MRVTGKDFIAVFSCGCPNFFHKLILSTICPETVNSESSPVYGNGESHTLRPMINQLFLFLCLSYLNK